jgi:hypothetical protein
MTVLHEIGALGREWLPFGLMLVLGIVALVTARHLVIVRQVAPAVAGTMVRQLIMLGLTALVALVLLLTLPLSDQARGQLVGFLGVLLTAAVALSSTTFIGNAMAGLMLRAVRNFRAGDFVEVDGHLGRVSEQGFLHTEIQTEERNLTTLPNLFLVTNLDALHEAGVEIVSPTFMNQRPIAADRRFIPAAAAQPATTVPAEAIPEELMFDKAEEAGSIEEARHQLERWSRRWRRRRRHATTRPTSVARRSSPTSSRFWARSANASRNGWNA